MLFFVKRILEYKRKYLIFFILLNLFCSSQEKKEEPKYIFVSSYGESYEDAVINAKIMMVELGLGSYVKSESITIDSQLKDMMVQSDTSGFIYNFEVIKFENESNGTRIEAKGLVSFEAVKDALENKYRDFGKPRFMILIDEYIDGREDSRQVNNTEVSLMASLKEFSFIDRSQLIDSNEFRNYISKDKKLSKDYKKMLVIAAKYESEILIIGYSKVNHGDFILNTNLKSIQVNITLKIINTGTSEILATISENGTHPDINLDQGIKNSTDLAIQKIRPLILSQLESKWKSGQNVRIIIRHISYDRLLDKGIINDIRKIRGVNSVNDKGYSNFHNGIVLEVEALYSGNKLYKKIRNISSSNGLKLKSLDVKNNLIILEIKE